MAEGAFFQVKDIFERDSDIWKFVSLDNGRTWNSASLTPLGNPNSAIGEREHRLVSLTMELPGLQ